MVVHAGPFPKIRFDVVLGSGVDLDWLAHPLSAVWRLATGGRGGEGGRVQFLPPLEDFVLVEEIGPPFSPGAVVDAAVLARVGGFGLPERAGERFRPGLVVVSDGRTGGMGGWLGGLRLCGCAAV